MEQLTAIPESMPKQSDLPLDDNGAEVNNLEQPKAPITYQDDFLDEANALREACESLYTGAQNTKLAAIMLLMNVCQVHGVSNKFVDGYWFYFICIYCLGTSAVMSLLLPSTCLN